MSDIYFIQVKGAGSHQMKRIVDKASDIQTEDNIVFITEEIDPMSKSEAKQYLVEMADALDMELSDA